MKNNPEQTLIDLIADQIQDDEKVLDGLGSGTLSLEELEEWRDRRWQAERVFLKETIRVIEQMRAEGFGRTMRHSDVQKFGMARRKGAKRAPARALKGFAARPERPVTKSKAPARGPAKVPDDRFTLALKDLGLPCNLRVAGTYDDVLDAGAWHARHVHNLRGTIDEVRDTVKTAIVEQQVTPYSLAERFPGRRSEEQVSDEAANQTRSSGVSSRYH